jgi:hypothetical protein
MNRLQGGKTNPMFSRQRKIASLKLVLFSALLLVSLVLGACTGAGTDGGAGDTGGDSGVTATETPMGDTGGTGGTGDTGDTGGDPNATTQP